MKLGYDGWEWVSYLWDFTQPYWSQLSVWQQDFLTDYHNRAKHNEEQTNCSPKQLAKLNEIADAMGLDQFEEGRLKDG